MVSLKIEDVRGFMSKLLTQEVFDNFYLSELSLGTFNYFTIAGRLNKEFFSEEELEQMQGREYSAWNEIRPIAFQLMKGKKTPLSFKIVLLLSAENTEKILTKANRTFRLEEIGGLFLNIKYENQGLHLITGTSVRTFSMDKSLEHAWDDNMKAFLKHYGILFEEE